jgi:hypothetical protein
VRFADVLARALGRREKAGPEATGAAAAPAERG